MFLFISLAVFQSFTVTAQSGTFDTPATAEFELTFDASFDNYPGAREAATYAMDILAHEIVSSVPIRISLNWVDGGSGGAASPARFFENFQNAPLQDVRYPAALANAIAGQKLTDPDEFDILISYTNSDNWYFGAEPNAAADQVDFVAVTLHEMLHGLGFLSLNAVSNGIGSFRTLTPYTTLITLGDGTPLTSLDDNSLELGNALTSDDLFLNGTYSTAALQGERPKLFAPLNYIPGRSISHLIGLTDNSNALMAPTVDNNIRNIGNIARGVLKDIGWELNNPTTFSLQIANGPIQEEVFAGNTLTKELIITNTSAIDATLVLSKESGDDFSRFPNGTTIDIPAGESRSVSILLDATALTKGLYRELLRFSGAGFTDIYIDAKLVVVDGTESPDFVANAVTVRFDSLAINSTASKRFFIANEGDADLTYTAILENTDIDFVTINPEEGTLKKPTTLGQLGNRTFITVNVDTQDLVDGTYETAIIFSTNDPEKPTVRIPVSVNVVRFFGKFDDISFDFGEREVGVVSDAFDQAINTGDADIKISKVSLKNQEDSSIQLDGWFSSTFSQDSIIPVRGGLLMAFIINPTQKGEITNTVIVESDDLREPFEIPISVVGTIPEPIITAESTLLTVNDGETVSVNFSVENTAAIPLVIEADFFDLNFDLDNPYADFQEIAVPAKSVTAFSFDLPADQFNKGTNTLQAEFVIFTSDFEFVSIYDELITLEKRVPEVTSFSLINSFTNEVVQTINNGDVIDIRDAVLSTVAANIGELPVKSVQFDYNGRIGYRTDNREPFFIGGDFFGTPRPFFFSLGNNTVTATPFSEFNGQGKAGCPLTINFEVIDSKLPRIAGFDLVDNQTNEVIKSIKENDSLFIEDYIENSVNIIARTDGEIVQQVIFEFDNGQREFAKNKPFTLKSEHIQEALASSGLSKLKVIPVGTDDNGRRSVGVQKNIYIFSERNNTTDKSPDLSFNETNRSFRVMPNPAKNRISFTSPITRNSVKVKIVNLIGQVVFSKDTFVTDDIGGGELDISQIPNGAYIIQIRDFNSGKAYRQKLIKK